MSDGIIAMNRFYQPIPDAGIIVMGTYTVAQLMIIMGIRSHILQPKMN
ncbi:MAG: lysoplasmalogenase family protein [Algoriphagus sp.]